MLMEGVLSILNPSCLALMAMGTVVGIIFGSLPGLTATMAMAMFIPMTYALGVKEGIALLLALYIGGCSGGLISAILLNIPGTPASMATCFDGRPMAEKGEAGKALGAGIVFSFLGTMIGLLALVLISPGLASIAIKFGPHEYFAITIFSLTLIITLSSENLVKGLITGLLGLMFATVGLGPIDSTPRYTFGNANLNGGFNILIVLVGAYAISEIVATAEGVHSGERKDLSVLTNFKIRGFGFTMKEFITQIPGMLRASAIGIALGILPGIGNGTSNMLAYTVAKNQSKYPEKFGTGVIDGIVASETSNNATIPGTIIPLLTLGIPGDSTAALLLGALVMKGVTPGPLIFQQNGAVVYSIYTAIGVSAFLMLVIEFFGLRAFVRILKVPTHILMPLVFVLCIVGAYGTNNLVFDCGALIFFGFVGYFLNKGGYPLAPLILGFVLGPIMELNFRRAISYSNGHYEEFVTQPISCAFLLLAVVSIVLNLRNYWRRKNKREDEKQ